MPAVSASWKTSDRCAIQSWRARGSRAALIAALVIFESVRFAHAHGEAHWIWVTQPRCCGPRDCDRVAEGGISRVNGGFLVLETGEVISEREALRSIDDHYWRCRYTSGVRMGQTRCLFAPVVGF